MRTKNSRKVNIPIRIAGLMLCLVLFSAYMTSGMLVRYATGGTTSGGGRAAKISVAVEGGADLEFVQADGVFNENDYVVTVTNNSEVAMRYTVEFVFPAGLEDVTVTRGSAEPQTATGTVVFSGSKDLAPGSEPQEETFTFAVTEHTAYTTDWHEATDTSTAIAVKDIDLDFDVLVTFTQID